ncbi:MAG: hypothetical protein SCARUB_01897 [Candidatus Scalindua rubra]|uniref:Uncharacterized protein n=1 Tax=Candidatus Scalindua rubra TaxID=1872076 RepID=A0A1E3XBH5_9BACT|nr:MAG: hypothetical protein SCARUB_01897 [Candidatus Scalindua rubra]
MGQSMIPRRISTILAWPKTLGFIEVRNNRFFLRNNFNSDLPVFQINDITQPLLPNTGDLIEYEEISERTNKASEIISYYKDLTKAERSNNAHIKLVNLVAERIRNYGGIPKCNQLIDLAVKLDQNYFFEMKSITHRNVKNQIRKGLSQLYEYRYLQNKHDAILILVIENPLNTTNQWVINYMENDRGIYLIWDGKDNLFGSEKSRSGLRFLNLN